MVSAIEESESDDLAKCLVRKFNDPLNKLNDNSDFKCSVEKNNTVRQFFQIVAKYFKMDVDSFYLTFSSYKSESRTGEKVFINHYLDNKRSSQIY